MQWDEGIHPQGRMQENHVGAATVTSKRSREGANQGVEMPGGLTAAGCGIPSPSPPSWVLRIVGRKWPAVKGMCEEAPSAHSQAGLTCLQLLRPLSSESKLPTWSLLLDSPAPVSAPVSHICSQPFSVFSHVLIVFHQLFSAVSCKVPTGVTIGPGEEETI